MSRRRGKGQNHVDVVAPKAKPRLNLLEPISLPCYHIVAQQVIHENILIPKIKNDCNIAHCPPPQYPTEFLRHVWRSSGVF